MKQRVGESVVSASERFNYILTLGHSRWSETSSSTPASISIYGPNILALWSLRVLPKMGWVLFVPKALCKYFNGIIVQCERRGLHVDTSQSWFDARSPQTSMKAGTGFAPLQNNRGCLSSSGVFFPPTRTARIIILNIQTKLPYNYRMSSGVFVTGEDHHLTYTAIFLWPQTWNVCVIIIIF